MSAGAPAAHGLDAGVHATAGTLARLRTFHTVDLLRGIAALAIVVFHAGFFYGLPAPPEGQIAVDLFFVMSGFIIAYRYDADLAAGLGAARFMAIRLVRLYPLFLLGTVLGLVPALAAVLGGKGDALHRGLVESFPFAPVMLPSRTALPRIAELYPLNFVAWSLALEIAVNALYAATFRIWTVRRLALVAAGGVVGLCVCAGVYGRLKYGYAWPQAPVGLVRVVYGFTMGVLIFRCRSARPRPAVAWWLPVALAVALFVVDPPCLRQLWEVAAVAALSPLIVLAATRAEPPPALRPVCAVAGVASYLVYSLHVPIVGLVLRGETLAHHDTQVQSPAAAIAFTMALAAVCIAAHLAYDKPVRRALMRRLDHEASSRLRWIAVARAVKS